MDGAPLTPQATGSSRSTTLAVFLAALAPMMTVPALRPLIIDTYRGGPTTLHLFVAAGMVGSAVGAPLVARWADRHQTHMRTAMALALLDTVLTLGTQSGAAPMWALFGMRMAHGAASMSLLALLFARFRETKQAVGNGVAAMVIALAFGPAIGGGLTRLGCGAPFLAAAAVSFAACLLLLACEGMSSRAASSAHVARTPTPRPFDSVPPESVRPRSLLAPLAVMMTQRLAIGGFVTAFAIRARLVHHISDARIGMSFSLLLISFAIGAFTIGRMRGATRWRFAPLGALMFGVGLVSVVLLPVAMLPVGLGAAGVGAALAYAPCLSLIADHHAPGGRATAMALAHSAGAVGMILGPLLAAAFERALGQMPSPERAAYFLTFVAAAHAVTTMVVSPKLRSLASPSLATNSTEESSAQ